MTEEPNRAKPTEGSAGDSFQTSIYRAGNERVVLGLPGLDYDTSTRAAISKSVKSYYRAHGMQFVRTAEDVARFLERQQRKGFMSGTARREAADNLASSAVGQALVHDVCSGLSLRATAAKRKVTLAEVRRVIQALIRRRSP